MDKKLIYDEDVVMRTLEKCDLNKRPNYKKLVKLLKDNIDDTKETFNTDFDITEEIENKKKILRNLKEKSINEEQNNEKNILKEIDGILTNIEIDLKTNSVEPKEKWLEIKNKIEKQQKSLEMVSEFFDFENKTDLVDINEDSLIKANIILKQLDEKN